MVNGSNGSNKFFERKSFAHKKRGSRPARLTAALLIVSLIVNEAWAGTMSVPASDRIAPAPGSLLSKEETRPALQDAFSAFSLPKRTGTIENLKTGNSPLYVFHIRDLHINEEAQLKISEIIDHLMQAFGIRTVFTEGSSGNISHGILSAYPDPEAREAAARALLRDGYLNAAEFTAVTRRPEMILKGAEDAELYRRNRETLLKIMEHQSGHESKLASLRKAAETVSPLVFSEEMRALLQGAKGYRDGRTGLIAFVKTLETLCASAGLERCAGRQMKTLLEIEGLEKGLRPDLLRAEFRRLMEKLKADGGTGEFLSRLAAAENETGWAPRDLSRAMDRLGASNERDDFRHLESYVKIRRLEKTIGRGLFREIQSAEARLGKILADTGDSKRLYRLMRIIGVYERAFQLALTPEDVRFLYENRHALASGRLEREMDGLLSKHGIVLAGFSVDFEGIQEALALYETFYDLALLRDKGLIGNTLSEIKNAPGNAVILVTGGFHTPAVERRLEEEGINFCTITPSIENKIDEDGDRKVYNEAMKTGLSPLGRAAGFKGGDTALQLQVPGRLPLAEDLEPFRNLDTPPALSDLIRRSERLDAAAYMTTVMGITGRYLQETSGRSVDPIEGTARLEGGERIFAEALYLPLHEAGTLTAREGPGRGRMLFPFSETLQAGYELRWFDSGAVPPAASSAEDIRIDLPGQRTLRVEVLRDRAEHAARTKTYQRKGRAVSRPERRPAVYVPPKEKIRSELRTRPEEVKPPVLKTIENAPPREAASSSPEPVSGTAGPDAPAERTPAEFSFALLPALFVDLPLLIAGLMTGTFIMNPLGTFLTIGAVRFGFAAALLLHEWLHAAALPDKKALEPGYLSGGNTAFDLFRSLLPAQPLAAAGYVRTPGEPAHLFARHIGWAGSLGYAAVLIGALFLAGHTLPWFTTALVPGAVWTAVQALLSDLIFPPEEEGLYCCGNQGALTKRRPDERKRLVPSRIEKLMGNMGQVTKVRGEQAAGRAVFGDKRIVRKRVVNPKRADLSVQLEKRAKKIVRAEEVKGNRPASKDVSLTIEHYRYGTSSPPAEVETHPHQWLKEKHLPRMRLIEGKLQKITSLFGHVITHNGDFDDFFIFGKDLGNFHIGLWLSFVLHQPLYTSGDSPKAAGMTDLIHTQGSWEASARLAYQLTLAKSAAEAFGGKLPFPDGPPAGRSIKWVYQYAAANYQNTAPDEKKLRQWGSVFESALSKYLPEINKLGLEDMKQVPEHIREALKADAKEGLLAQGFDRYAEEDLDAFLEAAVKAFFDFDLHESTKFFMSRAKGSFGLVTSVSDEPDHVIISVRAQPISIGFHQDGEEPLIAYASESAALKVPIDDEGTKIRYRLDLDQVNGEIVDVSLDGLRIYSESLRRDLTQEELAYSGRIIDMFDNPLVEPLAITSSKDRVGGDIRDIPKTLFDIRKDWQYESSFNRRTADDLVELLRQKAEGGEELSSPGEADVIITGIETSQWLGEQFAADLSSLFKDLDVRAVSSNKILSAARSGKIPYIGKNTIVIAISQSGQTFPTLNSTIVIERMIPGRVFAMTGELDTLMGAAVGQYYYKGAPFSKRIFTNGSGRRPAEPSTAASAAAHQTLTELLLYLAKRIPEVSSHPAPLGMNYEPKDIEDLGSLRNFIIDQSIPSIVGATIRGEKIDSVEHKNLVERGRFWALHILEPAYGWLLTFAYLYATVKMNFMLFTWLFGLAVPFLPIAGAALPLMEIAFLLDIGFYMSLGFVTMPLVLRIFQGREKWARSGKRTLVIGDISYVHQLLEQYVSKIFSMSYGIASIDVHGANPQDHMVHRFGHRVVRGTLVLLGRPNGLIANSEEEESWALMTAKQAKGVQNLKTGAEVIAIGHNPSANPNAQDHGVTLWSPEKNGAKPHAQLSETRFHSFERLISAFVLFHAMGKRVSNQWPLRYDMSRTQSGTRIATTASPVSGTALAKILKGNGKTEAPKKVLESPSELPFELLNGKPPKGAPAVKVRKVEGFEGLTRGIKENAPAPQRKSGEVKTEEKNPGRSELRRENPLAEAVDSKQAMLDDLWIASEIPFARYLDLAAESGVTAGVFFENIHGALKAEALPRSGLDQEGEIILNYRAGRHTDEFVMRLVKLLKGKDAVSALHLFRDPETAENDWEDLKARLRSASGFPAAKVFFADEGGYTSLEGLVDARLSEEKRSANDVVQILDPHRVKPKDTVFYEKTLLNAAPLARETIILLGSDQPVPDAQTYSIEDLLEMALRQSLAISRSA